MTRTNAGRDRRGQAALIGLVLLVGIVAIGSVGILLLGANANQESQAQAQDERVKQGFQELDGDIDAVARSENDSRSVDLDLPSDSDVAVREDATGRIWVNKTNFTTLTTKQIVNRSIGAVRYSRDDGTTYVFQGGGVFKEQGNNTRVLSPPAFAYELNKSGGNPTLTLPIVVTTGDERLTSGDVGIRHNKTIAPTNDVSLFEQDLVTVTVKSRWYVGWAQYFREIVGPSGVSVNHTRNTATMELVVPLKRKAIVAGIVSGASAEDVKLSNNLDLNSFDSALTDCDRCSGTGRTMLIAAGDVKMETGGSTQIDGDVVAGKNIYLNNTNDEITGNASYGDELKDCTGGSCAQISPGSSTSFVGGWQNDNASVINYQPVDKIIDSQVKRAKDNNNNTPNPHIDPTTNTTGSCTSSGTCEIHAGTYYLEGLSIGNGKVLFNTTQGNINLVVNGTISTGGGDNIKMEVIGSNRVNIWLDSEDSEALDWEKGSTDITNDRTQRLFIYMDKNAGAEFSSGNTDFYGVIFGPGDTPNNGVGLDFKNQAWLYGAAVGNFGAGSNNAEVVFDESLTRTNTIATSAKVPKLTFLHASVYEVCLQDADQNSNDCESP